MKYVALLTVLATASLLGCGKPEETSAPVVPPPEASAPATAAEPAPLPVQPAAPQAETVPATATDAASDQSAEPKSAPAVRSASAAPSDPAHGQQIYRQACAFCHDKGIAGAPKAGDAAAWSARLAQGMDALYAAALRGKGAMPAKGGNPALADADVKAAVDHLAAQAR